MISRLIFILLLSAAGLRAGTLVQFRTTVGSFDVELYDADKPITTKNFLRYVQNGIYTNMFLHRAIPNFVVQGGGFFTTNRFDSTAVSNVFSVPTFGAIKNEFGFGRRYSNVYGTIAMAKLGGDTNSATSQWYFNLADNAFLDANDTNNLFVVFGRVVRGTNVLNNFNLRSYGNGIVNLGGVFSDLPVLYTGQFYPFYNDLIYVDISLLNVAVAQSNNVRQVSWNSVSNKINYVEFTTNYPPVWQSLTNKTGDGSRLTINDSAVNSARRFYRVRVTY